MSSASSEDFVLRHVHVLDEAGGFGGDVDVHVKEGIIQAVGANLSVGDALDEDLEGAWLMPGVFDCHAHITVSSMDIKENLLTPNTLWTLRAADNARRTLAGGITFVRDPSGADMGLRTALGEGIATGPEVQIAVIMISSTGGHSDGHMSGSGEEHFTSCIVPSYPERPPFLADGPDEVTKVVRMMVRAGADWIKLAATGGFLSEHDSPDSAGYSREEIAAAVVEARRKGRDVMVHAYGGRGLTDSVAAGVRSIEHGTYLTEEQARAMSEGDCWLVPTLAIVDDMARWGAEGKLGPESAAKVAGKEPPVEHIAIAREHGVRMAIGTDFISAEQHGGNMRELALLQRAGMPVEEVLLAATRGGAELCGVADRLGSLRPGFQFDALVLDQEPTDLEIFAKGGASVLSRVYKAGRRVELGEES